MSGLAGISSGCLVVAAADAAQPSGLLLAGFVLGLLAAICFGWGIAFQKKHVMRLPAKATFVANVVAHLSDRGWLAATGVILLGWALEFLALRWAPTGLVLPSAVVGVAVTAALAVKWFGERLRRAEWTGVAACIAGVLLCGFSIDPEKEAKEGVLDGLRLSVVVAGLVVAAAACFVAPRRAPRWAESALSVSAGLLYAATGLLTKALALCGVDRLVVTAATLVALVVTSIAAVSVLQVAHRRARAVVLVSVTNVLSGFLPAAAGLFVFHEVVPGGIHLGLRLLALAALAGGLLVLARPASRVTDDGGAGPSCDDAGPEPVAAEAGHAPDDR